MTPQERCERCVHAEVCINIYSAFAEGYPEMCDYFHGTCEECKHIYIPEEKHRKPKKHEVGICKETGRYPHKGSYCQNWEEKHD